MTVSVGFRRQAGRPPRSSRRRNRCSSISGGLGNAVRPGDAEVKLKGMVAVGILVHQVEVCVVPGDPAYSAAQQQGGSTCRQ